MKKRWLLFLITMLLVHTAAAIEMDIGQSFGKAGEMLSRILSNDYAVFFITLIIGSIMLKGLYYSGLQKIPTVEASGHASSIAWSLSILTIIAFVWANKAGGVNGLLQNMGSFRLLLLGLVFILVYSGIKKTLSGN